jgi:hypothetical protein
VFLVSELALAMDGKISGLAKVSPVILAEF